MSQTSHEHPTFDRTTIKGAELAMDFLQAKNAEALRMRNQSRSQAKFTMLHYLNRMNLDVSNLPVVHVAGSKGKGSTCAFTEHILHAHGLKTGLYTSPHLVSITERFRINTESAPDGLFLDHFWKTWDALWTTTQNCSPDYPPMPAYFSFLTLVAFSLFSAEKVDVLVLEVGLGGKLDATNVIPHPFACAVSHLALEHTEILGSTLDLIAKEKAGIFKRGARLFTGEQDQIALRELEIAAQAVGGDLVTLPPMSPSTSPGLVKLGLIGDHQLGNASLAIALAHEAMKRLVQNGQNIHDFDSEAPPERYIMPSEEFPELLPLPKRFLAGLEQTSWPGRCQTLQCIDPPNLTFYLDGAHTEESIQLCINWFAGLAQERYVESQAQAQIQVQAKLKAQEDALKYGIPIQSQAAQAAQAASQLEDEYVLMFNCGHVRSPFLLLDPIVSQGFPRPIVPSTNTNTSLTEGVVRSENRNGHANEHETETETESKMCPQDIATAESINLANGLTSVGDVSGMSSMSSIPFISPSSGSNSISNGGVSSRQGHGHGSASHPEASSNYPIQFSNVVFCPFDYDRIHLQAPPSLGELSSQFAATLSQNHVKKWQKATDADVDVDTDTDAQRPSSIFPLGSIPMPLVVPANSAFFTNPSDLDDFSPQHEQIEIGLEQKSGSESDSFALATKKPLSFIQSPTLEVYPPPTTFSSSQATWQHTLAGTWQTLVNSHNNATTINSTNGFIPHPTFPSPWPSTSTTSPIHPMSGSLWNEKMASTSSLTCRETGGMYPYQSQNITSASAAVDRVRMLAHANPRKHYRALVTGSLYLVGNVLDSLSKKNSA